jgi:hypothetical protein
MPQYQGQFYTGAQAKGDILRQIFEGLRIGRQDGMAARDQRRMELEREQARADRLEQQQYTRGREATADAAAADERKIRDAQLLADLRARGVFRGPAPKNITEAVDLTGIGGVGRSFVQDPKRYSQLTDEFHIDDAQTPETKARVLSQSNKQAIARIAQRLSNGDQSAIGEAVAAGINISDVDPVRRPGTKQYMDAQAAELKMKDLMDARQQARQFNYGSRLATQRASTAGADAPKSTDGERKAASYLEMARAAMPVLDGAKTPGRLERGLSSIGLNEAVSDDMQQTWQAGLQFADAWLRYTSGANSPAPEIERVAQTFTVMPGDSPALRKQKAEARANALRAMEIGAGNALGNVTPMRAPAGSELTKAMSGDAPQSQSVMFAAPFDTNAPARKGGYRRP